MYRVKNLCAQFSAGVLNSGSWRLLQAGDDHDQDPEHGSKEYAKTNAQ
jgi:hypothetical protein